MILFMNIDDQNPRIHCENLLGSVAEVHVHIHHGDPVEPQPPRLVDPHCHVVEEAEAHGLAGLGVVAGGAYPGEYPLLGAGDDPPHPIDHRTGRPQRRVDALGRGDAQAGTACRPQEVEQWSLTTLREKLVKIGARIVRHGRYVVFQLAEVDVPRSLFAEILRRIDRLRGSPVPTP